MATNNITRLFNKKIKSCFRTFYSSNNNNNNNNYNNYNNNNNNGNNNNNNNNIIIIIKIKQKIYWLLIKCSH